MQTQKEQGAKVLKIIFGIMFFSVIALFFLGEIFLPAENPIGNGECVLLEDGWERVFSDGTRESIKVPGRCEAEWGETVRLEIILPQSQEDTWFCMRASQQDMLVYVGDELRKEYTTKETRLFGQNSASTFVFFEVFEEDAGKVLAIELHSDSEYAGFLNEVYVGDKYDIVRTLVHECAVVIMVSVYMLILSSIVVVIGIILRAVYKKSMDITYLGLGVLQLSMAMTVESRIRQFFLPNSSIAQHVGFLLTILIPYPFMVYVNRIQKGRYEKVYKAISVCVAANFVIATLLQIFDILGLADTMVVSYLLIIIMVIAIAVTICTDIKRKKIGEYGEVIFGFIAMIAVAVWETYVTFVPEVPYHGGIVLSFGLIILLFMAGIKTARDILGMEQEKQIAVGASEAKAKFLANMSHEIRTPINTIIGMNEMILRENRDKEVEEYAINVQNASRLLLGLINDILDFSKIEAGRLDILETDYYLSGLLADVISGIQIKADNKKLILHTDIEEALPGMLKGDEIRIRQILNNLLSNAVKYTKQGTVTLTVKGIYLQDTFVLCMSVKDTGIGIKKEDLEKLFDSFQRLEEQKNRYIEGTGLGLNITKQLVDLMGGSIEVESEYGKGSCFTVKIPQQVIDTAPIGNLQDANQRDTVVKEQSRVRLYAPTAEVLVVDDNEMNLAVVRALLKRTGIRLTMANDGIECLEACRQKKYDLILMDHMMPDPDGVETLHMLRKDERSLNRDTQVIVVTANVIVGMSEKYREEGFADYIAKPVAADELEDKIGKYLPTDKLKEDNCVVGEADTIPEPADSNVSHQGNHDKEEVEELFHIDKETALEYCDNSEEIYTELVETYYSQGQKYLSQLSEYYEARDWKNYKIIVHTIKSTSRLIGATAFSEEARKLEAAANEGNEEILLAESEKFFDMYKNMLAYIKR